MKRTERLLYEKNKPAQLLILLSIVLNALYSIFVLNSLDKNAGIGLLVILTIFLLLLGFLVAVKVSTYSEFWSYGAMGMGVFQVIRIFFSNHNLQGSMATIMGIVLVASGVACIAGGLFSLKRTKQRSQLHEQQ